MLLVYYHSSFRKEAKGFVHFLARSEKTNQKRSAIPKPPSKGDVNNEVQRPHLIVVLVWLTELSPLRGEP